MKTRILPLLLLLSWALSSCTGSGSGLPASVIPGGGINEAASGNDSRTQGSDAEGANSEDAAAPDSSGEARSNGGGAAVAGVAPSAQPTQPLVPQLGFFVDAKVVLEGKIYDPDCGKDGKAPPYTVPNIPIVKSWEKEAGSSQWTLKAVLGKYESEEDANNPYVLNTCGQMKARLYLLLGPQNNPCLWNNEAKLSASYKSEQGVFYSGESQVYTCQDAGNLPEALIVLRPLPLMRQYRP